MVERAEPDFERSEPGAMAADLALQVARAELDLLIALADGPRQGIVLLAAEGVYLDSFSNDDTRAIFLALWRAGDPFDPPMDKTAIAQLARELLRRVWCWDDDDERDYVTGGSIWGPGPLAALLYSITFDLLLLQSCARHLLELCDHVATMEGGAA